MRRPDLPERPEGLPEGLQVSGGGGVARRRRHDGLEVAEWAEPTGNSEARAQEGDGVQEGEEADLDSAHASDAVDSQ